MKMQTNEKYQPNTFYFYTGIIIYFKGSYKIILNFMCDLCVLCKSINII